MLWAMHITIIPSERKAADINIDHFTACLGVYELGPKMTYTISRDGDRLLGQSSGREPAELLPAGENMLFRKGALRGELLFVRDDAGRVTQMIQRRDNNEIVWRKIE
jgi:hypothetical protein